MLRVQEFAAAVFAVLVVGVACNDGGSEGSGAGCDISSTASTEIEGEQFSDPQGTYEITVAADWEPNHGTVIAEVEVWGVGEIDEGFAPNVNILTQTVESNDLETYLDSSIESGPALIDDFGLVCRDIIEGAHGQQLGVMVSTGSQGGRPLQFLGVFAIRSGQAVVVVATLTSPPDSFANLRQDVEPYLLTLRAI